MGKEKQTILINTLFSTQTIPTKFILAFDEQEDGYQIMLDEKIDIISPQKLAINNALSSINREFSIHFFYSKQ